jgi:hypothetical protein
MSKEKPKHRLEPRERLGTFWHFPELAGPDLSEEIVPGQHAAMELLDNFSVAEIFSEDPEVQARVFNSTNESESTAHLS